MMSGFVYANTTYLYRYYM